MAVRKYNKQVADSIKIGNGVTIAEGKLIGTDSSGNAALGSKTTGANVCAIGIAVAGPDNGYAAYSPVAKVDGFTGLTPGSQVYLGTTGGVTQTRPTTAGDLIQAVGVALSATTILFNVVPSGILAQAAATTTLG